MNNPKWLLMSPQSVLQPFDFTVDRLQSLESSMDDNVQVIVEAHVRFTRRIKPKLTNSPHSLKECSQRADWHLLWLPSTIQVGGYVYKAVVTM